MFSEKTLMLNYSKIRARSIFCEMATNDRLRVARISDLLFCKMFIVAQNS